MKRVNLKGTSGSGKSTFGVELARRLELPYVELDALHHGPNWSEPTDEEFRARVHEAMDAAPQGWVIDGNYEIKLGDLVIAEADTIVWLDLPLGIKTRRLWRRTAQRIRDDVELWNGNKESWSGVLWGRDTLLVDGARAFPPPARVAGPLRGRSALRPPALCRRGAGLAREQLALAPGAILVGHGRTSERHGHPAVQRHRGVDAAAAARRRDAYADLLAEHRRLLARGLRAHDGFDVDSEGDAFFVVFASASDAARRGAEAQRALAEHDWPDGHRDPRADGPPLRRAAPDRRQLRGARRPPRRAGHGGRRTAGRCSSRSRPGRCSTSASSCATWASTGSRTSPGPSASTSS